MQNCFEITNRALQSIEQTVNRALTGNKANRQQSKQLKEQTVNRANNQ